MEEAKMVHRANEIARFFSAYPHEEAVGSVANHLKQFWEPRFRRQLIEYAQGGGEGLHELVREAVATLTMPSGQH